MTRHSRSTGFLWHELFAWHEAGTFPAPFLEPTVSFDLPETRRRFRNLVDASGLLADLVALAPVLASDTALQRAHDQDYLERVRSLSEGAGGQVGPYANIPSRGLEIARLAAGAAIRAVDAVMAGEVDNAYALVRPAGHHATRSQGMGFCIFNNVAVAALHALEHHGLERVAVVDWDVHHGNGTQDIFWDDARVLTVSLHQDGLFTLGGGALDETGGPNAKGCNLNLPLPPGSGHAAYVEALRQVVLPALRRYRPQLILVASGLDALFRDPLGRMLLHSESYREMTRDLVEGADELCEGRLVLIHEGGYAPTVVPFAGLAILEELSGRKTDVVDPFLATALKLPGQTLSRDQKELIERASSAVDKVPAQR